MTVPTGGFCRLDLADTAEASIALGDFTRFAAFPAKFSSTLNLRLFVQFKAISWFSSNQIKGLPNSLGTSIEFSGIILIIFF